MKTIRSCSFVEPGGATTRFRAVVIGTMIFAICSMLSWRLIQLQVGGNKNYLKLAQNSHRRTDILEAARGSIIDCRGISLAVDEPVQRIVFDTVYLHNKKAMARALRHCENMDTVADIISAWDTREIRQRYVSRVARHLAQWTQRPAAEIEDEITKKYEKDGNGEVVISRDLSVRDGIRLRDALERDKLDEYKTLRARIGGVLFRDAFVRRYPSSTPVFHLVGKYGELKEKPALGQHGLCGLEKTWEEQLKGRPGHRIIEVDGAENELASYRGEVRPAVPGANLHTTIDTGLIRSIRDEIESPVRSKGELTVAEMKANRVIVIVFEPKTMALRAVVGRDYTGKEATPQTWNDAVQYVYEPGSTIKIATIAAALTHGKVSPATSIEINAEGDSVYDDDEILPITDDHSFPTLSVEGIMVHSSNIGAYKLARQMGLTKFRQYINNLGFHAKTGLGFPLEEKGRFPTQWNIQSLSRAAYGYAYSVTPGQMCNLLGCILNEGRWSPLRVSEAWTDNLGKPIETIPRTPPRQPISSKAARAVQNMLVQVVEVGTAKLAHSELFEIGGKTGTANKINPVTKGYDKHRQVVSFLGFIADATGPRLAGICIVDEPKLQDHMNYGGKLAAPLFRRIMERAMAYYEIAPTFAGRVKQVTTR